MSIKEILRLSLNNSAKSFTLPVIAIGNNIPRVIHQTFKTKELPIELQDNIKKIKKMNPGWKYKIYDDEDIEKFIKEFYGQLIFSYFQRIGPKYGAAKADLFRYLLLYKYGGVYIDIKSTFNKPLDSVILPEDRYLLSKWRNRKGEEHEGWGCSPDLKHVQGGEFQQWHIIAAAGHPFLKAVINNVLSNIDRYNPWLHGTGSSGVFRVTGPVAYTLAILPLMAENMHRITSDENLGFEYTFFKTVSYRPLFKFHYAKQTETVIKMYGFAKLSADLYGLTKEFKRYVFSIFNTKN